MNTRNRRQLATLVSELVRDIHPSRRPGNRRDREFAMLLGDALANALGQAGEGRSAGRWLGRPRDMPVAVFNGMMFECEHNKKTYNRIANSRRHPVTREPYISGATLGKIARRNGIAKHQNPTIHVGKDLKTWRAAG